MTDLRTAGAMLANCAFNLAQRKHLTDDERRSLEESRRAWDEALARDADAKPEGGGEVPFFGLRFGTGGLIVNTGTYGDEPAVIIDAAPEAGAVGEKAPDLPAGTVALARLVFPTATHAQRVADALVAPDRCTCLVDDRPEPWPCLVHPDAEFETVIEREPAATPPPSSTAPEADWVSRMAAEIGGRMSFQGDDEDSSIALFDLISNARGDTDIGHARAWLEEAIADAAESIATPAQPAVQGEREGYVLVPRKINYNMLAACNAVCDLTQSDPEDHRYDDGFKSAQAIWTAMIDAAGNGGES